MSSVIRLFARRIEDGPAGGPADKAMAEPRLSRLGGVSRPIRYPTIHGDVSAAVRHVQGRQPCPPVSQPLPLARRLLLQTYFRTDLSGSSRCFTTL